MRNVSFRWMVGGSAVSMLGNQFTQIALPWLMLKLTGDSIALGLTIALVAGPAAVFILVGGALVDRHSPKRVLMASKLVSTLILGTLAALSLSQHMTPALVYVLALAIGLASAFAAPAATSMLPHVVAPRHLQAANGFTLGIRQLAFMVGPVLAGFIITYTGHGGARTGPSADTSGLGWAFAFDAFSFLFSAWTLSKIRLHQDDAPREAPSVWRAIGAGLKGVWNDHALRTCFAYWGFVAFVIGSLQVALPMLANEKFHSAGALGMLMGANGAGTLLGMLASSRNAKLRVGSFGTTMLLFDGLLGLLLMPLGHISAVWQGVALLLTGGMLGGFMQVAIFTWIQRRVPRNLLGRTMSIFMFIFIGVPPIAAALTGWLMQHINVAELLAGCGVYLIVLALAAFLFSPMRAITDTPG